MFVKCGNGKCFMFKMLFLIDCFWLLEWLLWKNVYGVFF